MAILGTVMTMFSQMLTSSSNTGHTLGQAASLQAEARPRFRLSVEGIGLP